MSGKAIDDVLNRSFEKKSNFVLTRRSQHASNVAWRRASVGIYGGNLSWIFTSNGAKIYQQKYLSMFTDVVIMLKYISYGSNLFWINTSNEPNFGSKKHMQITR